MHKSRIVFTCVALLAVTALAAGPAHAATISNSTCDPQPTGEGGVDTVFGPGMAHFCETVQLDFAPAIVSDTAFFDLGSIVDTLTFTQVNQPFSVNLTAFYVNPNNADFLTRFTGLVVPETFDTNQFGDQWMYFRVENKHGSDAPPQQPADFTGSWEQVISYFTSGDPFGASRAMLHDSRPLDVFDKDITTFYSPFPIREGCGIDCLGFLTLNGDPTIGGSANDFSDVTVVVTPEPVSFVLVGTGLGLVFRQRRKNRK